MLKSIIKHYMVELWNNKFYTSLALLGIAVTIMIIMIVELKYEVQWHPGGPEKNNENIQYLTRTNYYRNNSSWSGGISLRVIEKHFQDVENCNSTGWSTDISWTFMGENEVEAYQTHLVNAGYWKVFDFTLLYGRYFTKEDVENKSKLLIVSEETSEKLTGKADGTGHTIEYDKELYKIIGVVENVATICSFSSADIWIPYTLAGEKPQELHKPGRWQVFFRTNSPEQANLLNQEVREVESKVQSESGEKEFYLFGPFDHKEIVFSRYGSSRRYKGMAHEMKSLFLKGLLLLLIPSLNLIGLNFMRINERAEELSIRKAFGASRLSIVRQIIVENLILSIIGGALGLLLAAIGLKLFSHHIIDVFASDKLANNIDLHFNYLSFFICLVFSALLSILSGIIPAWKMARIHPAEILKGGEL